MTKVALPRKTDGPVITRARDKGRNHKGKGFYLRDRYKNLKFVAWDGESTTDPNNPSDHRYVLFMNSEGDTVMSENGEALSTEKCLNLLCDVGATQSRNVINVAYGGSYDFFMMLKDLSYGKMRELYMRETYVRKDGTKGLKGICWWPKPTVENPEPLGFRIHYTPRSRLVVKRQKPAGGWERAVVLWDCVKIFQNSFVSALREWFPEAEMQEEIERIAEDKKRRGSFSFDMLSTDIVPYTQKECKHLVSMMERFRDSMNSMGIHNRRWDSAAAIAEVLMFNNGIKDYMPDKLPQQVQVASQYAYFGGRIEAIKYGRIPGPIYHYDVNSCYPSVYPLLPGLCSTDGRWVKHHDAPRPGSFSVSKVRWRDSSERVTDAFYPFPFRTPYGKTLYGVKGGVDPLTGCVGWYWEPEVTAALELSGLHIEVLETWEWQEGAYIRPFRYVRELYYRRMEVGKKTGEGRVIKTGLNASYGKTAQKAGWQMRDAAPPFHCTPWAGYITSHSRAKLYRAAMQAPESIISFNTDGIWSLAPLSLPLSTELGDWEYKTHDEMVIVMSGVYWTRNGEKWETHCRGFDTEDYETGAPAVSRDAVLRAWSEGRLKLPVKCTRFINFGSAVGGPRGRCDFSPNSPTLWKRRGSFYAAARDLDLYMTNGAKRRELSRAERLRREGKLRNPSEGPIDTAPMDIVEEESTPHMLGWVDLDDDTDEPVNYVGGVPAFIVDQEINDGVWS